MIFATEDQATRTDPSVDVFYNFTPSLTGVLTFNTDFSATEVDDRQVNLTRFSTFFPEKRDFFLQDVDIFFVRSRWHAAKQQGHERHAVFLAPNRSERRGTGRGYQ